MAKLGTLKLKTKAQAGVPMIVRDPFADVENESGEAPPLLAADGSPATLTLLGADSDTARKLDYQRAASAQNRLYAAMNLKAKKGAVVTAEDVAEQAAHDLERLVTLTVGWHGFEDEDDVAIPFSADAIRDLYTENPFIREQALAFVSDRSRFFARSSTPSVPSSSTTLNSAVVLEFMTAPSESN